MTSSPPSLCPLDSAEYWRLQSCALREAASVRCRTDRARLRNLDGPYDVACEIQLQELRPGPLFALY